MEYSGYCVRRRDSRGSLDLVGRWGLGGFSWRRQASSPVKGRVFADEWQLSGGEGRFPPDFVLASGRSKGGYEQARSSTVT
jgi:hypothetical protein